MGLKESVEATQRKSMDFFSLLGRRLRLIKLNRNSIVFLLFLCISICFWFMKSLQETSTITQDYTLKITGLPKNIIFTSDIPKTIKANISAKGYSILNYITRNDEHILYVNFDDIEKNSSKLVLDNGLLKRNLSKLLGNNLKVVSLTPTQVEAYYTKGKAISVPIKFWGKIETGLQHVLCGVEVLKDSAKVYAPLYMHDSIDVVNTEYVHLKDLEDTTIVRVGIKKIPGARITPDSVDVKVCVDLYTEKTLSVPIYSENCPRNKVLRTFPGKVNVTFRVSANMYNKITPDDFLLTVDFSKVKLSDKSCKVELKDKPEGAKHIRFSPEQVEFVIEQYGE